MEFPFIFSLVPVLWLKGVAIFLPASSRVKQKLCWVFICLCLIRFKYGAVDIMTRVIHILLKICFWTLEIREGEIEKNFFFLKNLDSLLYYSLLQMKKFTVQISARENNPDSDPIIVLKMATFYSAWLYFLTLGCDK